MTRMDDVLREIQNETERRLGSPAEIARIRAEWARGGDIPGISTGGQHHMLVPRSWQNRPEYGGTPSEDEDTFRGGEREWL